MMNNYETLPTGLSRILHNLLMDIVASENPVQLLCDRLSELSGDEEREFRALLGELKNRGFIKIDWASNSPYMVYALPLGKEYAANSERLLSVQESTLVNSMNPHDSIRMFIDRGNNMISEQERKMHQASREGMFLSATVSGVEFEKWKNDLKLFSARNLTMHPLYKELSAEIDRDDHGGWKSNTVLTNCIAKLMSISEDSDFWNHMSTKREEVTEMNKTDVFMVIGHDEEATAKTENLLLKMQLKPIILRNQASEGRTIIEKLEECTDVGFGVVLYTPCDMTADGRNRARQNVVLEHGYLIGKLGRSRVCALVKGDIELPGDIDGVVYINMERDSWERNLVKELQAAGYNADANKI